MAERKGSISKEEVVRSNEARKISKDPATTLRIQIRDHLRAMGNALVQKEFEGTTLQEIKRRAEALQHLIDSSPSELRYPQYAPGKMKYSRDWSKWMLDNGYSGVTSILSPPIKFQYHETHLIGRVTFDRMYEGPNGHVHGGYLAGVFDSVLGSTQKYTKAFGFTAFLHVDYKKPVPLETPLIFKSYVDRVENENKLYLKADCYIENQPETVLAASHALFVARIAKGENGWKMLSKNRFIAQIPKGSRPKL